MGVWAEPLGGQMDEDFFAGAPPPVSVHSPDLHAGLPSVVPQTERRATDPGQQTAPRLRHRRQNGVVLTSPPVSTSPRSPMTAPGQMGTARRPATGCL